VSNPGLYRGISAPPIIRGRFDPIFAHRDFGILGDGYEPEDYQLQRFFDEAANRKAVFESPLMRALHTGSLFVRSGSRIKGNGATIQAHPGTGATCTGIFLTDEQNNFTGTTAPSKIRIDDLNYDGKGAVRRAAGLLTNGAGAGFYLFNAIDVIVSRCHVFDQPGDAFFMGGTDSVGLSANCFFENCHAEQSGRNGFSFVGVFMCGAEGCISEDQTYGASTGGFSCGYDVEPDDIHSQNANLDLIGCKAKNCATAGFNASNNALNSRVNWISPMAVNCNVGYFASAAGGTKIIGARYSGNGADFSGIAESISGFVGA
jgi:hypothetical protein